MVSRRPCFCAATEALPGAKRAEDGTRRRGRREIVVSGVQFSATGREWAAATSDGLLVCVPLHHCRRHKALFYVMQLLLLSSFRIALFA